MNEEGRRLPYREDDPDDVHTPQAAAPSESPELLGQAEADVAAAVAGVRAALAAYDAMQRDVVERCRVAALATEHVRAARDRVLRLAVDSGVTVGDLARRTDLRPSEVTRAMMSAD